MCEIDLLGLQEPALSGLWLPIFPEINLGYLSSLRGAMVTICYPALMLASSFPVIVQVGPLRKKLNNSVAGEATERLPQCLAHLKPQV